MDSRAEDGKLIIAVSSTFKKKKRKKCHLHVFCRKPFCGNLMRSFRHRNMHKVLWNWTTFKLIYQSSYNSLFKEGEAINIKQIKFTCIYLKHFIKYKAEGEILQLVNA